MIGMSDSPWLAFCNHCDLQLMNVVPARGMPFLSCIQGNNINFRLTGYRTGCYGLI